MLNLNSILERSTKEFANYATNILKTNCFKEDNSRQRFYPSLFSVCEKILHFFRTLQKNPLKTPFKESFVGTFSLGSPNHHSCKLLTLN